MSNCSMNIDSTNNYTGNNYTMKSHSLSGPEQTV